MAYLSAIPLKRAMRLSAPPACARCTLLTGVHPLVRPCAACTLWAGQASREPLIQVALHGMTTSFGRCGVFPPSRKPKCTARRPRVPWVPGNRVFPAGPPRPFPVDRGGPVLGFSLSCAGPYQRTHSPDEWQSYSRRLDGFPAPDAVWEQETRSARGRSGQRVGLGSTRIASRLRPPRVSQRLPFLACRSCRDPVGHGSQGLRS